LTPEEYINADQSVETAGDLSNADIIAHMSRETQGDGDDQDNNGDDVDNGDDDCATTYQVSLAEAQTCHISVLFTLAPHRKFHGSPEIIPEAIEDN
jgi:hypothetical protein